VTGKLRNGVRAGVVALAAACVVVTGGSGALAATPQNSTPKQTLTPVSGDCSKDIAGTSANAQLTAQGYASVQVKNGVARLGKANGVAELSNCAKEAGVKVDRIQVVLTWKVTLNKKSTCAQALNSTSGLSCSSSGKVLTISMTKTCKNTASCSLVSTRTTVIDPPGQRSVKKVKYSVQARGKQLGDSWTRLNTSPIGWNA